MILLDANTVIFYLKGRESVVKRLHATSPRELGIPSVVAYEVEFGALKIGPSRRRELVSEFIGNLVQVPFDSDGALAAARIRTDLESRGAMIGPLDLLIAGTALSRSALLITNNTKEFSRVKGLRVADWTKD
jgi:tRNA(fMet)-specific endonuclease VapC